MNNILQGPHFTAASMDAIGKELAPDTFFNPHMNVLGTCLGVLGISMIVVFVVTTIFLLYGIMCRIPGDYDITVVSSALQQHGLKIVWFNAAKYTPSSIAYASLHGVIINKHSPGMLWGSSPHWLSLLRTQQPFTSPIDVPTDTWVNLDSKLKSPREIKDIEVFIRDTLQEAKKNKPVVLLLIVPEATQDSDVYIQQPNE